MTPVTPVTPVTAPPMIDRPQAAWEATGADRLVAPDVHGFGGLQGGISLALATHSIAEQQLDLHELRSVHARYHRAIREQVSVRLGDIERGRFLDHATAELSANGARCVSVAATFGRPTMRTEPTQAPMPDSQPPEACDEFELPTEFVPFGRFVEIRPTIPARPFVGADSPHLAAWIRLRDDDHPTDLLRLLVLIDALAPSASAPLTAPIPIPTLELTVHPTPAIHRTDSPWVLLDATSTVSGDGWVDETITAWGLDGQHLATARQLRLIRPG